MNNRFLSGSSLLGVAAHLLTAHLSPALPPNPALSCPRHSTIKVLTWFSAEQTAIAWTTRASPWYLTAIILHILSMKPGTFSIKRDYQFLWSWSVVQDAHCSLTITLPSRASHAPARFRSFDVCLKRAMRQLLECWISSLALLPCPSSMKRSWVLVAQDAVTLTALEHFLYIIIHTPHISSCLSLIL